MKNLSFSDQNFIDFSCFFNSAPGDRFKRSKVPVYTQKCDFGAIFDFRDFQKGAFWTTFWLKISIWSHPAELRKRSRARPCAERPSKTDFYRIFLILGRFGTVFGWILHHFPRFFYGFASISRPHGHP